MRPIGMTKHYLRAYHMWLVCPMPSWTVLLRLLPLLVWPAQLAIDDHVAALCRAVGSPEMRVRWAATTVTGTRGVTKACPTSTRCRDGLKNVLCHSCVQLSTFSISLSSAQRQHHGNQCMRWRHGVGRVDPPLCGASGSKSTKGTWILCYEYSVSSS